MEGLLGGYVLHCASHICKTASTIAQFLIILIQLTLLCTTNKEPCRTNQKKKKKKQLIHVPDVFPLKIRLRHDETCRGEF